MRKISLLHVASVVLLSCLVVISCKKPINSERPANNNSRLLSYTKINTSYSSISSTTAVPSTTNENYRFYYDATNRVSSIVFTTNDSTLKEQNSIFTYSNDTVFKVTTNILTNMVIERDTFVYNSTKQLATAITPHLVTSYQYYGNLLGTINYKFHNDTDAYVTSTHTYTSDNGDFLAHNYDGKLIGNLEQYNRITPFGVAWYAYTISPLTGLISFAPTATLKQDGVGGFTSTLTNYNEAPIAFTSGDAAGHYDTVFVPGEKWRNETYHFYTEMADRPGDYLQIQSFTKYGYNVFQNKHLVESMTSQNHRNTNITYSVDAYSNITQTSAVTFDSVLNRTVETYNFQYETF